MADSYIRWVPSAATTRRIGRWHVRGYRATRGLLGARMDGLDMLLLTTRGRKTGIARTIPIPYFRVPQLGDGALALIASYGGGPVDPAWALNIDANPVVGVEVKRVRATARARRAEGEEREALWKSITTEHPRYLQYQETTDREIPVVVLELDRPV